MGRKLHIPDEPLALQSEAREWLYRSPADGLRRIDDGEWIVDALWPTWQEPLQQSGVERHQFQQIVTGYRNEVRLWVMGERPWAHCVEGLIGRVERRMKRAPPRDADVGLARRSRHVSYVSGEEEVHVSTNNYANPEVLVGTDWVAEHLDDPSIRLVEVDVDTSAYETGHVPGAIGWDWQKDLQRHPVRDVPTKQEWEALLSRSGIGNDTPVILYGDNNNWFAAFAYWVFKLYGHDDVRLMNGGRAKWLAENRPLTTDTPQAVAATYSATEPKLELRAFRDDVRDAIERNGSVLIDVRSPAEYSGELLAPENLPQEGAQRGGHIPTAQNVPWASAVAEDGTFKSRDELEKIYGDAGVRPGKEVFAYCRIGERSAHTWFVLRELLGVNTVRNYDGSWTEWGSLIGSPIEAGK